MIRYIEWGEKIGRVLDGYATEGCVDIDPSNPDSLRAFWSALPADLRLSLAKTALDKGER